MNIWSHLPHGCRRFLLEQPLPESWKKHIEASLNHNPSAPLEASSKICMDRKSDYSIPAALVILVVSAFILFSILN